MVPFQSYQHQKEPKSQIQYRQFSQKVITLQLWSQTLDFFLEKLQEWDRLGQKRKQNQLLRKLYQALTQKLKLLYFIFRVLVQVGLWYRLFQSLLSLLI